MNHFQGRLRHELDGEFLRKFYDSFDGDDLNELISHLDRYPDDGDEPVEHLPEFRVVRWESAACRRDVFYLYRERLGVVIYVDCVEPPDQGYRWFRNLDSVQLMEIGLKLFELIEKTFELFFAFQLRSKKDVRIGGSRDYQKEAAQRS
jgi:hypothetical protein